MAAAVDTLPAIYTKIDSSEEGPKLLAPPEQSRESLPQRSGNSGSHSLSAQGQRTIHLDEPSYSPRQWDYVYDRPLDPINLDDPVVDLRSNQSSRWGTIRRSIAAFKTRVSAGHAKQSLDAGR